MREKLSGGNHAGKRSPAVAAVLYGSDKTNLNVIPSKKSLKKARDAIREKTGPKKCFKPTPKVLVDLNTFLHGWSNCFEFGYFPF